MCVCVVVEMVVNLPTTICCVHWQICALIHEVIYKIIFLICIPWLGLGYCVNKNMDII